MASAANLKPGSIAGDARQSSPVAPVPESPGAGTAIPPDPKAPLPFAANPAAAAESLLAGTITEADVIKAVNCWAPHDFAAAKA